ncbi:hypothetical protein [uncultured Algibacter sp.]|uniref:hypothetical protein n=1 Tax=uncultured Algibacter sp. TaxID=298659 RepID=UPI002619B8FB|nr:hypothetical protein [uncultured Algibacter sp.]
MKSFMKNLLLLPFFALIMFTSCQDEVTEITDPNEAEALVADSNLTAMVSATAKFDGSKDNIIDRANCLSVNLPVTVVVNGLEIIIDSEEDYKTIEAIYNEFEDDDDRLDIVFPIVIITDNHDEITINSAAEMQEFVAKCKGENEEDDDIECIDFKYPISFSIFNPNFQIIDVISVANDRELHRFIKRVKDAEVIASINYPVTLVYADGSEVVVNRNQELASTIEEAKDACDEDDDNDYGDDDFTKERLDNLLKSCPWVVYEFERNQDNLRDVYVEYVMNFKEDNVVKVRKRNGDLLTGTWTTRVTDHGALIKLEFETLVDFTLEWFVYDLEPGKIKLYQSGGNKIILKKNCDIVDITKERIANYLQECLWRISRLSIDGIDKEKDYIGTPFKFFEDNVVKLRVKGELVEGTYNILAYNTAGFVLQINLEDRPDLQLEWFVTFLESGLIKLESLGNRENKMVLKRHCPDGDDDLNFIDDVLISSDWEVALYQDGDINKTEVFFNYTFDFLESGRIKAINPNNVVDGDGSWLAYRNEGLYLGLHFGPEEPYTVLNHRWKIVEITQERIELKDLNANGAIERILVLEKKA